MTQNSWKILVTKSIDDAMNCYFFLKGTKMRANSRPGETYPYACAYVCVYACLCVCLCVCVCYLHQVLGGCRLSAWTRDKLSIWHLNPLVSEKYLNISNKFLSLQHISFLLLHPSPPGVLCWSLPALTINIRHFTIRVDGYKLKILDYLILFSPKIKIAKISINKLVFHNITTGPKFQKKMETEFIMFLFPKIWLLPNKLST